MTNYASKGSALYADLYAYGGRCAVSNVSFGSGSFSYYYVSPADALLSTVTASPTSVIADGSAQATVTVTLKDVNGASVGSGKTVSLSQVSGHSTIISVNNGLTDNNGVATFTVTGTTVGTVIYTAMETTSNVTLSQTATVNFVEKAVTGIAITTTPAKIAYIAGQSFDPAGMVVTASYSDGTSEAVIGFTITPSGALATTDTNVTISYAGQTAVQAIAVTARDVTGIAISTPPIKTVYMAGQSFDPSGMVVTASYSDGTSEAVTGYTITPSGALATTDTSVAISYAGHTATQAVTVTAKTVASIVITTPPAKIAHIAGQSFDPSGMVVTATYNDGTSEVVTGYTIAPSGALTTTDTNVIISYAGQTAVQTITVTTRALTGIAITTPPTKTAYIVGQSFVATGMVVTASYNDGTSEAVAGYTITPSGALSTAQTNVTISYAGQTAVQAITVTARAVTGIAITTAPTKTAYIAGQSFDPSGMVVTATYNYGTSEAVTGYTITPSGALSTAQTSVTISYAGQIAVQTITVTAEVVTDMVIPVTAEVVITVAPEQQTDQDGNITEETYRVPDEAASEVRVAVAHGATVVNIKLEESVSGMPVDKVNVILPPAVIAAASEGGSTAITVSTPNATLTLPPALVQALVEKGQPLELKIARVPVGNISEQLPSSFRTHAEPLVINTTLQGITGVSMPLQLKLPWDESERTAFLDSLRMFAIHSDGDQGLISDLQFDIDESVSPPVLIGVSFFVDKFSSFTLVEVPTQPLVTVVGKRGYTFANTRMDMVACYYKGNDTYMPIRMLQAFGVEFDWDETTLTATLRYLGKTIKLTIDSTHAVINGTLTPIIGASGAHMAPELAPGRTMIPLRFVSEYLGFRVHWAIDHTITITLPR